VQNLLPSNLLSKNLKSKIYRAVILPVAFYGCKTWSLTWWVEYRLRVFEGWGVEENIWAVEGPDNGEWRKLHNENINDLYCSSKLFG